MLYLGNIAEMDVNENSAGAERAAQTLGGTSYGTPADPLARHLVEITADDRNNNGDIPNDENQASGGFLGGLFGGNRDEYIYHDADGDGSSNQYEVDTSFQIANTTVTFRNPDGTLETEQMTVRIMQDTDGNAFLMPPPEGAPDAEVEALTSRPIVSIEFPTGSSNYSLNFSGIYADRHEFPCFARGTLIETEHGPLPVEELVPGMLVMTRDRGLQPLCWIGSRDLDRRVLEANPNLRPIRIAAGALGQGLPRRDLVVSPQHRILVRSKIAQKMFGAPEVLVAAKQLLQIDGIDIAHDMAEVEYFHFLFDRHEIVLSEGAETESLYTGAQALKSVGAAARAEIFAIFPELRDRAGDEPPPGARPLVSGRMGRKLAVRHAQHRRALVQ